MLNILESEMAEDSMKEIKFRYTNWRGETAIRRAVPVKIWFGSTDWHPEEQWLMTALDLDRGQERDFALLDMTFSEER